MTPSPAARNSPSDHEPLHPQVALRSPAEIMRLERMGSFFPTRLSFLRSLLRDLAAQGSSVERTDWSLDGAGFGHAAYAVRLHDRDYTLICYTAPLDDEDRTDRVIAEAWDACFVLFDGRPTRAEIEALSKEATCQEAGRYHDRVLILSRANKSVRLFEHVVDALADGRQPDKDKVSQIGYLMRTTAVYGNGKFGLADRATVTRHAGLTHPFRLEMLTVWLIREFTLDLVEHIAREKVGDKAEKLSADLRRQLGIGNSTGLGMAPFLVGHPALINNWILVRETALARVRAIDTAPSSVQERVVSICENMTRHLAEWNVADHSEQARIEGLRGEWWMFAEIVPTLMKQSQPYDRIIQESRSYSCDLQELVVSLVLEPNGELIDGLTDCMHADEGFVLDPSMSAGRLRELLAEHYGWCNEIDADDPRSSAMVWYVSEEKLEPRLGERRAGANDNCEMPHAIAHFVAALQHDLSGVDDHISMAEFLAGHPRHRFMVRRAQLVSHHPYGEVQDNLLDAKIRPIDLLRCKLSFFGASRFDPRSDRWTRITLFAGTPCADDLTVHSAENCFLPSFATVE